MRDQGIDSVWWWNRFQQHTVAYIFPLMSWLMRILVFLLWILSLVKSLSTLHKCNSTIIFSPGWYNYVLHVWHWDPPSLFLLWWWKHLQTIVVFIVAMKDTPKMQWHLLFVRASLPSQSEDKPACWWSCTSPQSVWQTCWGFIAVYHLAHWN